MAVAVAALLGVFLLVTVLGLGAFAVGRAVLREDRGHLMSDDRGRPGDGMRQGPGNGKGLGQGQGNGRGNGRNKEKDKNTGPGHGRGNGPRDDEDAAPGMPPGLGQRAPGQGAPGRGVPGLGGAMHGELTTADADGQPVTRVFQVGEVTAYTEGKTLAVKSADGFTATYTITADTVTTRAAAPAVGATVRVVADKEGLAVTRLTVVERPQG